MAPAFRIRDVAAGELADILALNEAAVPHVNSLDLQQMKELHDQAAWFRVAARKQGNRPCAFLIGLTPEAKYQSPNFLWFCRNYQSFAYIDRIAVAEDARRNGLATTLYEDFETAFSGTVPMLACEVNLRPSNTASMAFHRRRGFRQVGSQPLDDGSKEVAMLVKNLLR
jgi:predicted GNAT superfamily acetyltransferase